MGIIINHYKCLLNKVPVFSKLFDKHDDVLGVEHVKIQNFRDNHLGKGIFTSFFSKKLESWIVFGTDLQPKNVPKIVRIRVFSGVWIQVSLVLGNKKITTNYRASMWWCWNFIFSIKKKLLRNFSNNTFHGNLRGLYLPPVPRFSEIAGLYRGVLKHWSPSLFPKKNPYGPAI